MPGPKFKKKKKRNPFSRMTFSLFSAHKQNKAAQSQAPKGGFLWLRHAAAAARTYSLLSSKLHEGANTTTCRPGRGHQSRPWKKSDSRLKGVAQKTETKT